MTTPPSPQEEKVQKAYGELVAAIATAVPEIEWNAHEYDDYDIYPSCNRCGKEVDNSTCIRPITLDDILRAMQNKAIPVIGVDINGYFIDCDDDLHNVHIYDAQNEGWRLGFPLSEQSDECKIFLHSLLHE